MTIKSTVTEESLNVLQLRAKERQKAQKAFLKKVPKNKALQLLPKLHEEAFDKIDCLDCANCCKNYSPRFKMPDIKRIAKHLKMKESQFIATFLYMDEDGDYVLQSKPCPFLGEDNYCTIYDVRPRDCHRYPYTDEDVLLKQVGLTLKNASSCPAVFHVVERMMELISE